MYFLGIGCDLSLFIRDFILFIFKRFYLFIETQRERVRERERERETEAETQAEGEAGCVQGARHGTQSWVSSFMPWAEGGTKPLSHWGFPGVF